jgi:leader peptidase (prepilin peptidase)/N-methyltransferase
MSWDNPVTATVPVSTGARERPTAIALALALIVAALAALAFSTLALDRALVAAFLAGVLVALSAIDIERRIIPNRIVLPATALALVAQLALFPARALDWTLAPILVAILLSIPQLLGRSWMGMGDVKLALLLGVGLGWGVFGALLLAFLCVFPVALLVLIRGGMAARKTAVPFGPFLSLGALIVLFGPHLAGLPTS